MAARAFGSGCFGNIGAFVGCLRWAVPAGNGRQILCPTDTCTVCRQVVERQLLVGVGPDACGKRDTDGEAVNHCHCRRQPVYRDKCGRRFVVGIQAVGGC